jgi:hypothetical protein
LPSGRSIKSHATPKWVKYCDLILILKVAQFFYTPSGLAKVTLCRKAGAPNEVIAHTRPSTPIDKDWKACSPNTASHDSPCGFITVTPTRRRIEPLAAIAHNSNGSSGRPL